MNIEPKNILIVRTDRIGDLVLTLPLAGLIKKQFPNSKVSFLVRDYTKNIVNNHPFIDEVLVFKEVNGNSSLFSNINLIKQKNFDSCIVVYPRFKISLIVFLSRVKNRIGTGFRWYSFLFNQKVYEHRKNAERHELEYNINLLEKLGIKNSITDSNIIYDLKVEKSVLSNDAQPDRERSAQLIVSWKTDEPSTSQVAYDSGLGDEYSQKTKIESNIKTEHVVIISNLAPNPTDLRRSKISVF